MGGKFSASTLDQIRSANDIVEVIGSYLPLKHAGANWVALCPFHKEKTPSFNVSPGRQIFHCFGCQKGGDVFTFLIEYENIDFGEAVRRLADRAGIPLETASGAEQEERHLKEKLWSIHEAISQRWHTALTHEAGGEMAREYLAKRKVSPEAIEEFRIGYAPESWDDTVNWAQAKGFDLALAEQSGLIVRKDANAGFYDRFRGRLMFPIRDEQGRVVAFSGRILDAEAKAAKYVNSPETPIFSKRRVFYGLDKTKRAILDAKFAVVCEGQLDLIACYMAGVRNIVAPQGTAFTADHARILKRYVNEVVLCFDSDTAGQSAAVRVLDDLLECGLAIRVAALPAPHDPDSFIKERGAEAFNSLIQGARGFFDFYLDYLCQHHDITTDRGCVEVLSSMGEAVGKTRNSVLKEKYSQKTALRLNVSPQAVQKEFAKAKIPGAPDEPESVEVENDAPAPPLTQEYWLLKYLFLDDSDINWVAENLKLEWLSHPGVRAIVEQRIAAHTSGQWRGVAALLTELPEGPTRSLLTEAVSDPRAIPNPKQQLLDVVRWLRDHELDRLLRQVSLRLAAPDLPGSDAVELMRQQQTLRRQKQQALPQPAI
jgi:DNA primase